jgi:Ferritin-like domain
MLTVARVVEHVAIGAYLGDVHVIEDPIIRTDGASIITVKARHGTMLNLFNGASAYSTAFDLALLPNEVLPIAGSFITNLNSEGCNLGITRTLS